MTGLLRAASKWKRRLFPFHEIIQRLDHLEELSKRMSMWASRLDANLGNLERSGSPNTFNPSLKAEDCKPPSIFLSRDVHAPYTFGSTACRTDFFHLPLYKFWCDQIREAPGFKRKQWEWVYISHALFERGLLKPGSRGVGFGVGQEPLVDLFASHGCEVLATDLGEEEARGTGWIETSQHSASKDALYKGISTRSDFENLVSFRPVNMNNIPNDIREYDFCYSSCSIEHVGSLDLSKSFLENVLSVLKPGGWSIHTTELVINSDDETIETGQTVLWRRKDFEAVAHLLRSNGHFVEPLDFNLGSHPLDKYVDLPPYKESPHLRLLIAEKFQSTSFGMIVRKAL